MKLIVAESAGFCFGVQRAIAICEKASEQYSNCVTLGPIIHNANEVQRLESFGVHAVSDISEISNEHTVIISSHGATKTAHEALDAFGVTVIDATCPDVKKNHDIVRRESAEGRTIIIIGQKHHPEVIAMASWCERCVVFETPSELEKWLKTASYTDIPISLVSQTTNSESNYNSCIKIIKKVCTNINLFDTICAATCKRQREAADLSIIADVMIIVGGKNSANSLRLADICIENCKRVMFIENADELDITNIRQSDTVVITAGASTPTWIIKEVTHKMSEEVIKDQTITESKQQDSPPGTEAVALTDAPETIDAVTEVLESADEPRVVEEVVVAVDPPGEDSEQAKEAEVAVETAVKEATATEESTETSEDKDDSANVPETFEEMLEKSIKTLHTGEKVTGIVTSITATEVSVDLGTKQSGYIPITEFTDDVNTNIDDIIKIGDAIESFVMRVNDVEGMVMLSKKRLDAIKNWDIIEKAKENRTVVEGTVIEENKGGVVVSVKGVRVFVPASQTGLPKSAPMSELLKRPVKLRITEVNQSRRRVVGSIRAVQADERREKSEKVWNDIETGKQYDGIVKSMTSYGVFVDIGGVDGMIHISELSWTRVKQPSEVMSVGDEVSVYVLSFDKDNRKISLGYKKLEDNPWTKFTTQYSIGDVVNVKVVKMMPFGAFAEICTGVDGLIHISQITDHRIGLPSEVLSDGQLVDVKITEIDNDRKKVSLSIRALLDPSSQPLKASEVEAAKDSYDNAPVVVYDTEAPPPAEHEDVEEGDPAVEEETAETAN